MTNEQKISIFIKMLHAELMMEKEQTAIARARKHNREYSIQEHTKNYNWWNTYTEGIFDVLLVMGIADEYDNWAIGKNSLDAL